MVLFESIWFSSPSKLPSKPWASESCIGCNPLVEDLLVSVLIFMLLVFTQFNVFTNVELLLLGLDGLGGPVLISLLWSFLLSSLSTNLLCLHNSTELTKKPYNGPFWHSYLFTSSW